MSEFINVSDYIKLLDEQMIILETILEHQNKADSLLESALNRDFLQNPKLVIHDFLCVLSDFLKEAKRLNQGLLISTSKITSILKSFEPSSDMGPIH